MRAAILGLVGAASVFAGNIGVFDFTELPGTDFSATAGVFNTPLSTYPYYPRPEGQAASGRGYSQWGTGTVPVILFGGQCYEYYNVGFGANTCALVPGTDSYQSDALIFAEPDDPGLYNIFEMVPSGNQGNTSFLWYSDVPDPWTLTYGDCRDSTTIVSCPGYVDGTTAELPVWGLLSNGYQNIGSLTVRFSDQSVAASSPEPASILLIGSGLAFICLALRVHPRHPPGVSAVSPGLRTTSGLKYFSVFLTRVWRK